MVLMGTEFQSTPVSEDGRTWCAMALPVESMCFNPRPSVKTGELLVEVDGPNGKLFQSTPVSEDGRTVIKAASTPETGVSIHARQ